MAWLFSIFLCNFSTHYQVAVGHIDCCVAFWNTYLHLGVLRKNKIAAEIGVVRRSMVKHTDERVKLVYEILQAIRVIKVRFGLGSELSEPRRKAL